MDLKKLESCVSKLKVLTREECTSCIYQWVLTKHIRLDEFRELIAWLGNNKQDKPKEESDESLDLSGTEPITMVEIPQSMGNCGLHTWLDNSILG